MTPDPIFRPHLTVTGDGPIALLFVHGLGAHQGLWRHLVSRLGGRYRIALMDLAGCGRAAAPSERDTSYDSLDGHAQDLVAAASRLRDRKLVLVVHSVGCMVGLLADLKAPQLFDAHVMLAPSPRYLDEPGYTGGFDRAAVEDNLKAIATSASGWARAMAPALMGPDSSAGQRAELVDAIRQAHPAALARFARATFLSDHRAQLRQLVKPTLLLQCTDDPIAPVQVGQSMHRLLPDGRLHVLPTRGHFPHVLEPGRCAELIDRFLSSLGLAPPA